MKRNYKITEEQASFGTTLKVEMWDEYGCKRTVYERTVELATERIYDFWEEVKERQKSIKLLDKAIVECVDIDGEVGINVNLD